MKGQWGNFQLPMPPSYIDFFFVKAKHLSKSINSNFIQPWNLLEFTILLVQKSILKTNGANILQIWRIFILNFHSAAFFQCKKG